MHDLAFPTFEPCRTSIISYSVHIHDWSFCVVVIILSIVLREHILVEHYSFYENMKKDWGHR